MWQTHQWVSAVKVGERVQEVLLRLPKGVQLVIARFERVLDRGRGGLQLVHSQGGSVQSLRITGTTECHQVFHCLSIKIT